MKDETTVTTTRETGKRRRVRAPFNRLGGTRARSRLGLPEIVALAAAALLLVTAIASYLLLLRPQRTRLRAMTDERAQLQKQLQDMESSFVKNQDAESGARTILDSLVSFETEHLGNGAQGSTLVIEELNRLIRKNSLRISGGLAFTQLQETAPGETRERQRRGGASEQTAARIVESVFPGVAITLTVEGTYPKLRQFIRDVEADRQFIVINTVELEGIADSGGTRTSASAPTVSTGEDVPDISARAADSGLRGTLVSLRLDMAAYFRRTSTMSPGAQPATTDGAQR